MFCVTVFTESMRQKLGKNDIDDTWGIECREENDKKNIVMFIFLLICSFV